MPVSGLQNLTVGDIRIDFTHEGERFLGLGGIRLQDVQLRSDRVPMFAHVRTPYGVEFVEPVLEEVDGRPDQTVLRFSFKQRQAAIMEWMLHECRPRVATAGRAERPRPVEDLELSLTLAPVTRDFGPFAAAGFSYQYGYTCQSHPIYAITDHASWEIGGSALGNTIYQRQEVRRFSDPDEAYSTEWYLPGITNPNIFQFKPFQTQMQGFTLTVGEGGALVTWATEVAHIRTLLEKKHNEDVLEHWHEHCADLGPTLTTSPMEVLWVPGDFNGAALANLYFHISELIYARLHEQAGLRRERISTYGVMEEWDLPEIRNYVDKGAPRLLQAGVKTIYIANMFENNMNTFGVGNMCCTVDYRIAETVGQESVKAICDRAHAAGAEVQMWGNTAISDLAWKCSQRNGKPQRIRFLPLKDSIMEALKNAEAPFVRNAFGAIEADHYSPSFCQLNLLDPVVRTYWHKRWKEAHDEIGLDGIFLDSSFNMTSDKFHWSYWPDGLQRGATIDQTHLHGHNRPAEEPAPRILTQYHAHLSLIAEMQRYGYHYAAEDIGVFGLHRSGPSICDRMCNLFMWFDSYCNFDPVAVASAGENPERIFFKGLAYRVMWSLYWDPDNDELSWGVYSRKSEQDAPTDAQLQLLSIYNEVEAEMLDREVLKNETAVLYRNPKSRVIWAVEAGTIPLGATSRIEDLVNSTTRTERILHTEARHVYRVW